MKYKVLPQNAPKLVLNFGHSPLYILLNTNNADNTNIFLAHGGAERNFDF